MNSQSGNDVLKEVSSDAKVKATFEDEVDKTRQDNKTFSAFLQTSINKNANPHPVLVAFLVLVIIFILWFLYNNFQPKITGVWVDTAGNKYVISKKDKSAISISSKDHIFNGNMEKNVIDLEGGLGLWDGKNTILLPNNVSLSRRK